MLLLAVEFVVVVDVDVDVASWRVRTLWCLGVCSSDDSCVPNTSGWGCSDLGCGTVEFPSCCCHFASFPVSHYALRRWVMVGVVAILTVRALLVDPFDYYPSHFVVVAGTVL